MILMQRFKSIGVSNWVELFLRIFLGFKLKNDYFCTSEVLFGTCTITITLFPPNIEEFSL